MKKSWYSVKAKAGEKKAEISIFDEIGFWGVTAASFIGELKALGDVTEIDVMINSPGGSVFDGLAIYNALRQHPANVTVKVMGVAASAASFIAMAGDKIVMPENAFMMVHNPMGGVFGNADDMRDWADTLDKIAASLIGIYVARTGKSESEVKDLLDAETWMTAAEAKELGFADEVEAEMKIAAAFDVEQLPEKIRAAFDAGTPEPEAEDQPEPSDTLSDRIKALADKAGFGDYASIFALSAASVEDAQAAINNAREVKALCDLVNVSNRAEAFIKTGTPIAKVRETIVNERASDDERRPTNTAPRNPTAAPTEKQPAALNLSDVWAARRKQSR